MHGNGKEEQIPPSCSTRLHPSLGSRNGQARHMRLVQGSEQSPVAALLGKQGNQAGLQGAANVFCLMPASS